MTMSSGKGILCIQPSCPGHKVNKKGKSYGLRECSIKKRKETERRKNQPRKRGPKPRPKSAPMSKYRRKTANLRERMRMGEINTAFENLREKLPNPVQSEKGKCEKLTKINILHVAINYIRAMENLLETGDSGIRSFSEMVKNPLRDENDSKIEMQRILAVLMKKAEAKAAAALAGGGPSVEPEQPRRRKKQQSRKFGTNSQNVLFGKGKIKSEIKEEFDFEDDEDEDEENDVDYDFDEDDDEEMNNFGDQQNEEIKNFPDWKSLSSTLLPSFPTSLPSSGTSPPNTLAEFSKPSASSTPKAFARSSTTTTTTAFFPMTTMSTSTTTNSFSSSSTSSSPSSSLSISSSDSSCNLMVPQSLKRQPDPLFAGLNFDPATAAGNSDEMIKEFFTDFVDMVDTLPDLDFEEHFEMFP